MTSKFDLLGYELTRPVGDAEAVATALAIVNEACAPAAGGVVLAELTRCFSVTQSRGHDQTDMQATLTAMVDGLRDFPADVIRDGCRSYAKCEKWRPSLSEIREYCWHRYRARHSLRETLRRVA